MQTKDLTKMAMLAALVCLLTFIIKIPVPATGGYTHLGDCMIFIGVLLLGWRKGALAAALGAAMADLLSGAAIWIIPTFIIKGLMAATMGLLTEKIWVKTKFGWIFGAVVGGMIQVVGYTSVKIFYYDWVIALTTVPNIVMQTIIGIVITAALVTALKRTAAGIQLFGKD